MTKPTLFRLGRWFEISLTGSHKSVHIHFFFPILWRIGKVLKNGKWVKKPKIQPIVKGDVR